MLKYDVVIGKTTNSLGTAVNVNALEITEYKAEELDFGVLTIPATTRFENFQILDRVDITVTDGINTEVYDPFLIIADEVTPVSKKGLFKHTITFIEDIHKFEKILSGNVFITQPLVGTKKTLLDVMNHIKDVVPFERASVHTATRLFEIDTDLSTFLDTIEAPQFFFSGMNLREMINGVASYVNGIGRMEANRNLVFSFYNEILSVIGIDNDVIHKTLKNQTKYFTSSIESSIENATGADNEERAVIVHPSEDGFVSMRSTDLKLTDETFEFRVPYPIERIKKVEYKTRVRFLFYYEVATFNNLVNIGSNNDFLGVAGRIKATTLFKVTALNRYYAYNETGETAFRNGVFHLNGDIFEVFPIGIEFLEPPQFGFNANTPGGVFFHELFDVTPRIYEFNNYKRLDLDFTNLQDRWEQDLQANTMHFQIGGKTISNNRLFGLFDGANVIESFYRRVMYASGYGIGAHLIPTFNSENSLLRNNWNEQEYRITYVPYFGTRVRLNKDDVTDHPYNTQMSANQGERIVSAERLLRNIYGMAQRLGQDEIEFKRFYTDLSEQFDLGDITSDGFVVASKHITYYLNYYMVNYMLSKNFNRFANRIALNQENRPFDISLGSKTTTRNLLYNEYVEVDTVAKTNTSLIRSGGVGVFMNTIQPTSSSSLDKPIKYGVFAGAELVDVEPTEGLLIHPIAFSEGNSLNFYWSFDDVIKAGDQLGFGNYSRPNSLFGINFDFFNQILGVIGVDSNISADTPVYNNRLIRYTDNEDKLDNFELSFGNTINEFSPTNLPAVPIPNDNLALIGGHSNKGVFNDSFVVRKDKSEILSMNYVVSVLPNYQYNNKIVVGREFVFSNNLIIANKNATLVVYTSISDTYNSLENRFVKGTATNHTFVTSVESGSGKIVATIPNINTFSSWAIGDTDGNLYLGVNVDTDITNTVYFNFKNKRENISYIFDDVAVVQLLAPRNLVLTPGETTIAASWEDDQNSDSYEVEIRTIAPFVSGFISEPPTTNKFITFSNLVRGHTYQVRVRSTKDNIVSFFVSQTATTLSDAPKVTGFTLSRTTGVTLLASWNPASNVNGYVVERRFPHEAWDTNAVVETSTGANQTTASLFGIAVNRIAVGRVKAFNSSGFGLPSDEDIEVRPQVTGRGATAISNTVIRATWDPLSNLLQPTVNQEIGFEIKRTSMTVLASGTSTGGGTNQITDTSKSFTPNAFVGKTIYIRTGVHAEKSSVITSNTATSITFQTVITTSPQELQGVDYSVIGTESNTPQTERVLHTAESYDFTGLSTQSFHLIGVKAYYQYNDANFGDTVFSDEQFFTIRTLAVSLPADAIAPVITDRAGFPTGSSLSWNVFNPNNFTVQVAIGFTTGSATNFNVNLGANLTAVYTVDGLAFNTTRTLFSRFRVGATPDFVFSTESSKSQTTTPPPSPPVPTGLQVTNETQNSATASWSAVQAATSGYQVLVNPGGLLFPTGFGNSFNSVSITGLTANITYTAQVRSRGVDGSGASDYSAGVQFTTLSGPPSTPLNLVISKTQTGNFLFLNASWDAVIGATGYDVDISSNSSFSSFVFQVANTSSTNITTSPNNQLLPNTYYVRVRAKNASGNSFYQTGQFALALSAAAMPVTATLSKTPGVLQIDWTVFDTFAQTYEWQVFTNSSFTGTPTRSGSVTRPTLTSGSIAGLTVGGTFYARVRAVNALGSIGYKNASPFPNGLVL